MPRLSRVRALICVALFAAQFSFPAHATVDAVVQGTVFDGTLQPADGAVVILHDAHGATAGRVVTGKDGAFLFHIDLGDYTVEASLPGHADAHEHVHAASGETRTIELYCVLSSMVTHIVEQVPRAPLPSRATGSLTTLGREALEALPQGDARPITEVLATQPGFVFDSFGNVYARGNHANIQYQIDGIPIPDSVGNVFAQALPVRLVQDLEIFTGGMPAEFGNRLAAVVNITSRHAGATPEGSAQLRYGSFETIEPSASYSRTLGPVGVFVGGSYLSTERALDPPSVDPILHDEGQNARLFVRLDWRPTRHDRLELFGTYAYSAFHIPIDPSVAPLDPAQPGQVRPTDSYGNDSPAFVPRDTNATETEHEVFTAVSWVHELSQRGQVQVAPYFKLSQGVLSSDPAHALGATADPGSTTSDVTRRAEHAGVVAHVSLQLGGHVLKFGAQADYLAGRTDYTAFTRDDGAVAGGPDPALTSSGSDRTAALLSGIYVQDRWEHGRLTLQAGARLDLQHVILGSGARDDQLGVSPRLGVSFAFIKDVVAHAFAGVNWQPPAPLDAGSAARTLGVVPAGTEVPYDVKAQTDVYGEVGLDARVAKPLRLGVVGWGRYAWNQLDDVAVGSTNLVANYNFDRGRAVGVEGRADLVVDYRLTAFANVSWEIAQGQGIASAKFLFSPEELASTAWQTLDHAQTLTANVGATVKEKGAAATLLASYGSGLRTGPNNTMSVPEHVRLDATLQYTFEQLPLRPQLAFDVINLLDAHYAYRIANGFVGSSWAPPRSAFVRLSFPLGARTPK